MGAEATVRRQSGSLAAFLELLALSGIAIAQPFLDVLSKNAELFVARRTTGLQAVLLVVGVVLVPPALAFALEAVIGRAVPRARPWVHGVLVGGFAAIFVLEVTKQQTSLGPAALLVAGAMGGALVAALVMRSRLARQLLHYLAVAPVVFAVLFLVFSPVTDVVFGGEEPAAAATGIGSPKRVVLVVLDELPTQSLLDGSGHVDRELFPSFAALADDATWYRNESSVAAFTRGAVPAILTGRYPSDPDALPTAAEYPQSLFTLLGGEYEANVHEVITSLCPETVCELGAGGFAGLVERSSDLWAEFASPNRTEAKFEDADAAASALPTARQFVRSLRPGTERRLDMVHIELPHYPWHYVPTLQDYGLSTEPPGESYSVWAPGPGVVAARQRHLLQTQAADTLLGDIVGRLQELDAYDDALVIVTADHGVSFTPGEPARNPSAVNYPQVLWTPLFVKYPGQGEAVVDDRPAQSIDVLPTIADVLDAPLPARVDGRSLLGPPRAEGMRRVFPWIWLPTPKDLMPPEGQGYVEVDGARGFAVAMAGRAALLGGDPSLRIYRRSAYGTLIGADAAPLVRDQPGEETASIAEVERFAHVDPGAERVPWVWNVGTITGVGAGRTVAVTVNGKIAAISETLAPEAGAATFTFLVPPALVREGANDVRVQLVRGTPASPTLDPVPPAR